MYYLAYASALAVSTSVLAGNPPAACAETLVFVANGSGDQDYVSDALCSLTRKNSLPLCVRRVAWSRTHLGTLDLHDKAGQELAGQRLAASVVAERSAHPHRPICLVGHSAGAHVVLSAAARLPEGSVERIVLLAPAVSRVYDLRPALRASCRGIDSYYSKADCTLLAVETFCLTADRRKALTAGRVGFAPACPSAPSDQKLRQYPFAPCMKEFGHTGGHYGWTRQPFLREFVVPLLCGERVEAR